MSEILLCNKTQGPEEKYELLSISFEIFNKLGLKLDWFKK